MIVHFLLHGVTLCRMDGTPNTWPDDHRWVTSPHERDVSCPECLRKLKEKTLDATR